MLPLPSKEDILKVLVFDEETGSFYRRKKGKLKAAGWICKKGYRWIRLGKQVYAASRLAFKVIYDRDPIEVDHRDLNKDNNRPNNIREATRAENCRNKAVRADNKVGLKGVVRAKNNRYYAVIFYDKKQRHIGTFDTAEAAHYAYQEASAKAFGEFARS